MTLLQKRDKARREQAEHSRMAALHLLRTALRELLPRQPVIVFGSVLRPGCFHEKSDVDIALISEPGAMSEFRLQAELEERLKRPVDVVLLDHVRFRDKIEREGEMWMN